MANEKYLYLNPGTEKHSFLATRRDEQWQRLSPKQKELLEKWTTGLASGINVKIRETTDLRKTDYEDPITGYAVNLAEFIDAMKEMSQPISKNIRLFRSVRSDEFNWLKSTNQWDTPLSTTTNDALNDTFGTLGSTDWKREAGWSHITPSGYRVNLYATNDTRGLFIGDKTSYDEEQNEFVLAPKTKSRMLPSENDHVINLQTFPESYTDEMIKNYPLPIIGPERMELTKHDLKKRFCEEYEQ